MALKQEGSVADYKWKYVELAAPLDGIPEEVLHSRFINGLEASIRAELRLMNPINLSEAMETAMKIEVKNHWDVREMHGQALCKGSLWYH